MFNWSLLPNEIKRMIFMYNRVSFQSKSKYELKQLKYGKLKLMNEINLINSTNHSTNHSTHKIIYRLGKCYYKDYELELI